MSLGRSSFTGDREYPVKRLREQDGEAAHSGTGGVRGGGSGHKRGRWMQRGEQSSDEACSLSRSEG